MRRSIAVTALLASGLAAPLSVPSVGLAAPTRWNAFAEYDQTSLVRANRAVLNQPGSDKVELLAEFPNLDDNQQWRDPNLVHLFPTTSDGKWPITELNNASQFCPRMIALTNTINTVEDSVISIFTSGLEDLGELAKMKADLDTFKVNNKSAFTILAAKEAQLASLRAQIEASEALISQVDLLIAQQQETLSELEAQQQCLEDQAANGVPNTAEAKKLSDDIAAKRNTAAGYQTAIDALRAAGQGTAVMEQLLATVNAEIAQLQSRLDALVSAYRADAAARAAAFQPSIDEASAELAALRTEKSGYNTSLADLRRAHIDALSDPDYIAAKGVVEGYKTALNEYIEFNDTFRQLRDPIVRDASFAVNLAKTNFNDLAKMNAGFGEGAFDVWDAEVTQLPQHIAAATGNVNAVLGQLLNVNMKSTTGTKLAEKPFLYEIRNIDPTTGTILDTTSLDDLLPTPQNFDGWDKLTVVASGSDQKITVDTGVTVGDNSVKEVYTIAGGRPFARVRLGLGTYCGKLDTVNDAAPVAVTNVSTGLSLAVLPQRFAFRQRDLTHAGVFDIPVDVEYKRAITLRPFEGRCSVDSYDYASMTRNWGHKKINILGIYKKETHWDDRRETYFEKDGFQCTFLNPELVPEDAKKEIDALNLMVLNEAYARFISRTAKRFTIEPVDSGELELFKQDNPRHTWAPTMQALCGGEPICLITVELFKNIDLNVTNGSSSHVKNSTFSMDVDARKVLTITEAASHSGAFGFYVNQ